MPHARGLQEASPDPTSVQSRRRTAQEEGGQKKTTVWSILGKHRKPGETKRMQDVGFYRLHNMGCPSF